MSVFEDTHVKLAHGNGGRLMNELIEEVFARHLANANLDTSLDAAAMKLSPGMIPVVTTDGFIVQPLEFPGGDIGSLAIHGTVNDLAVSGATPRYITLSAIIEEGLELKQLDRIIESAGKAARQAGVDVVAGDTKVTPHGSGGGLYLVSTGIGERRPDINLNPKNIVPGDAVLVSGPVGDHGISVMLAREEFDLKGDVRSDNADVSDLTRALLDLNGLRFMRDPTRGGIATVAHEIAKTSSCDVYLNEEILPVRDQVRSVCDILGYDPYYLACEGRVVAIVSNEQKNEALAIWKAIPAGKDAEIVGHIKQGAGNVILQTLIGGERLLEELEDDPLPRIC